MQDTASLPTRTNGGTFQLDQPSVVTPSATDLGPEGHNVYRQQWPFDAEPDTA